MKHSMIWKTTIREIKGSLGRFLAIFAIVALGVGFFAGLKITKTDFLLSMNDYYGKTAFFDYRILGELGYSENQVEELKKQDDVVAAEGAVYFDAYYSVGDGGEKVARFHSITKDVNKIVLAAGRMPENETECLADSFYFGKDDIGEEITLTKRNPEADLVSFSSKSFTIVGLVNSPLYVQFERGNSKIGKGSVDVFFYLPADAFQVEYFTEIFVKLRHDYGIYTQAYQSFMEEKEDVWKDLAVLISEHRFEELPEIINDAKATLEARIEEGFSKLDDARKKLDDARTQIDDANLKVEADKKLINDGWAKLSEAKENREISETELVNAEDDLWDKEKELTKFEERLAKGLKEYENGLRKYEEALKKFQEEIANGEKEIGKLEERLEKKEIPETYLLGRETNIGYVCFESDSAIVEGIANVFPVFFFLVAALICMTTMNRMVEEQRTQIGVLKALGYGDGRITFKFLFYSGSAAISGAILGYFAGTRIFPYVIWTVYGIMYRAGAIRFAFDPALAGVSLAVSLLCSVGTTYLSCQGELNSHASTLMRPRAPKAGKRVLLERFTFIWKRLSFLKKVAVRNIMRYKKRLIMMVLGIAGCTGLILTGFGLKDSIAGVAKMQYSEVQFHDLAVTLKDEVDDEFLARLENLRKNGLGSYLAYQESSLELSYEKGHKSVTVITFPKELEDREMSEYVSLKSKQGEKLGKPGLGEVIVTDKIARMLGIQEGSEIILRDNDQKALKVKVSGIAVNYVYNFVFMDQSTWEQGWSVPYVKKSIYVKALEEDTVKELMPRIMELPGVAYVTATIDSVKRFEAMMNSMNLIVILVTACAAGLAFIVLFNLTNINITERIREIATIKVLGFYPGETALYVFRENFVLTVIGAFVGLGLGKLLHAFVMHEINVDMVSFGVKIDPVSYVYAIVLTLLFSVIVSLLMNGRLDKISMTESLKGVD